MRLSILQVAENNQSNDEKSNFFRRCIKPLTVSLGAFAFNLLVSLPASAQGNYWEATGDGGFYSSATAACYASYRSFSANDGLEPNWFSPGYSNRGELTSMACKWERGEPGYWGTTGHAYLRCPSGTYRSSDGNNCLGEPAEEVSECNVGNPINILSGAKIQQFTDFTVGRGRLYFKRTYSSHATSLNNELGRKWASNFHPRVRGEYRGYYGQFAVTEEDGSVIRFSRNSGAWIEPGLSATGSRWSHASQLKRKDVRGYTLTEVSSTLLTLTSPDGLERDFEFTATGSADPILTEIRYPDGYTISLTYNSDRRVTDATDTDGHTLTFTYSDVGLLTSVTAPDSTVYKYEYELLPGHPWMNNVQIIPSNGFQYLSLPKAVLYPDDTPGDDTDNPREEYFYNHPNYSTGLTSVKDERGITTATWDYAWAGIGTGWRAISSVGPNGTNLTTISEETPRQQYKVTNALGKETLYNYSQKGGLKRVSSVDGVATTLCDASTNSVSYDSNGHVSSRTAAEGQVTSLTVDSGTGLPSTIVSGSGSANAQTADFIWDTAKRRPTEIEHDGVRIEFTYDSDWNVTQRKLTDITSHSVPYSTNGSTRIWNYTWNSEGTLASADGPLAGSGDTASFTYDSKNNLASVTNELGHTTTVNSVDGMGRPTQITEANGLVTAFTYSPRGWVETMTETAGGVSRVTSMTYDDAGNMTRVTLPDGGWLDYDYNDSGWIEEVTSSLGDTIAYQHDLLGNVTSTNYTSLSSTSAASITTQYDELGRVIQTLGGAGDQANFSYDRSDRLTDLTDGAGKTWLRGFDALNRVISETDPESDDVQYGWDSNGDVTSFDDARNLTTSYTYNGFGDLIYEDNPDRGAITYWYDAAGRMTRMLTAEGDDIDYTYDDGGRLTSRTATGTHSYTETFTYDSGTTGTGYLTGQTDMFGTVSYTYNGFGELTSEARTVGGTAYTTALDRTSLGDIDTIAYPSGREVEYIRSPLGRITTINTRENSSSIWQPVASNMAWAPNGPLTQYTSSNGLENERPVDASYRLQSIDVLDGSTSLLDKTIGRDGESRVTSISDGNDSALNATYDYTDDGRLKTAIGAWGERRWTYDAIGNRLSESEYDSGGNLLSTANYAYGASDNRLISVDDGDPTLKRDFTYNSDGNTTEDVRRASSTFTYDYTATGRLKTVNDAGAAVASYIYDAFERRVSRAVGGSEVHFIYGPGGRPIAEHDGASGSVQREYIWLGDMLIGMVEGGALYAVHGGHLGQPVLVTSASKGVVWQAETAPFGEVVPSVTGTDTGLRYPGQWEQVESALFQNWHRDYDPSLGRYLQSDPLGMAAGQSIYGYAGQSPLNSIDPSGLCPFCPSPGDWMMADAAASNDLSGYLNGLREGFAEALGFPIPPQQQFGAICDTIPMISVPKEIGQAQGKKIGLSVLGATGPALGLRAAGASALPRGTSINRFFGSRNVNQMRRALKRKFGPPRSRRNNNNTIAETYYNPRTGRSFNLHRSPDHRGGRPHVDVRRRGSQYRERNINLRE